MGYKILAVNPGSTSTKIALYEDDNCLFTVNLELENIDYGNGNGESNLENLKKSVIAEVKKQGYSMEEIDAFSGRGGAMSMSAFGVYEIGEKILEASQGYRNGHVHACLYSPHLVHSLGEKYGKPAYILNAQSVDELELKARFTGFPGVWRLSGLHALNHKEVGARASEAIGRKYNEANIIVGHLGGGISIVAHKKGRMVDFSGGSGEGPMAPTRSGTVCLRDVVNMAYSGEYSKTDMMELISMHSGLLGHLGTEDGREIERRINAGDTYAEAVYQAMIYQICKYIGAMAVTLEGKVDMIALTGGLAYSQYIVGEIRRQTEWIAPIRIFPGEYEMDSLGNGLLRVLNGQDKTMEYTGIPVFDEKAIMDTRKVY